MYGELVPIGGGDSIPLLQTSLLIGRRSRCDIVLDLPNVSSKHCELEYLEGHWRVRDLASRNGTKVNGERVDLKWIYPGEQLSVAKNHFTFTYEAVGPAPPEDDDPFAMSLMEKAGLEQQKRRPEREVAALPPAARKPANTNFDADEDAALDFLLDD